SSGRSDDRVLDGDALHPVPAHLRLRLRDDQRPGRTARRDEAAGAEDLRDRLLPVRDGLRRDADRRPVRDPARDLAPPTQAVAQPMTGAHRLAPGRVVTWTL